MEQMMVVAAVVATAVLMCVIVRAYRKVLMYVTGVVLVRELCKGRKQDRFIVEFHLSKHKPLDGKNLDMVTDYFRKKGDERPIFYMQNEGDRDLFLKCMDQIDLLTLSYPQADHKVRFMGLERKELDEAAPYIRRNIYYFRDAFDAVLSYIEMREKGA